MLSLREYRPKTDRLADLLPWAALVGPGVVLGKDGSFLRTLRFRGPDLDSATEAQVVVANAQLNNALKRLGGGWALYIEARRFHTADYLPEGKFPDPLSWMVDAERRDAFERGGESFDTAYFLTLQYLPPTERTMSVAGLFVGRAAEQIDSGRYVSALDQFVTQTERIADILSHALHDVGFLGDEALLTYLHSTVSTKRHSVAVPETPVYLDVLLADSPLLGGLQPRLGDDHLRTVSITGFPGSTTPALLDALNRLPIEYRWVTRYLPLDKVDAGRLLESYRRRWFAKRKGLFALLQEAMTRQESALVDSPALQKSADADEAMRELAEDLVSYGYFTATIVVWDADPRRAAEKEREVERVVNGLGFVTQRETVNAVEAWLSTLPGQAYANVRRPLVNSLNLAHMVPFSAVWSGPEWDSHLDAPPLLYARTDGHTPFRLTFAVGGVGHKMVIGPTGSGKSVLLALLALQFRRYPGAQVIIFDKGEAALAATLGVGGAHYELGTREAGLSFQPLADVDQIEERRWAQDWILGLLTSDGLAVPPPRKEAVWDALEALAAAPRHQRTMTGLRVLVQDDEVRHSLAAYTVDGAFGHILDADEEQALGASWQCFEMQALLALPTVVAPVLAYLFHRLEKLFRGAPTLLILDEAWLFLDHPVFASQMREWLKTLRKANVGVIFATQSIDDALNSEIAATLVESCPVRIFLPNDRATEPQSAEAYVRLGLNERQIRLIANALPRRQYYYQSREGNRLIDLDLGEIALAFCGASRPEDRALIKRLVARSGQPAFVRTYLEERNMPWVAELFTAEAAE
jgi:type IV secretion system protein VirB4